MMRLINSASGGAPASIDTLDALWRRAEQLGRIAVDMGIFSELYEVNIKFKRNGTGTTVWAQGKGQDIHSALRQAILEAEMLQ